MKKKTETTTAVVTDRQAEARDWRAMDLFQHTLEREITDGRKDVRDRLEYVQRRIAEALDRLTKDGSCWTGFIAAVGDLDQAATLLRENISRANALKSALLHDERKQAEQDAVRANLTAIIMKSGGAS